MLPQELIDGIIECAKDDVTALRKYSLVCRSWAVSSQRRLFSSICLDPGRDPYVSRPLHKTFLVSGPFQRFASVAKRSSHILHYTRRIGLCIPRYWHELEDKDVYAERVVALILTLPSLCHVSLQLLDYIPEWLAFLDRMFACFREREPMHHPSSITLSIADPFLANFGFFRHIAVRQLSLIGRETYADDVHIPPPSNPVMFEHLRTLSVSLKPGAMRQFGAWLHYMPHLEELEFSLYDDQEVVAAYRIIAGGLPPSVSILSLYKEPDAFLFDGRLKKAVIPAISVTHLKLKMDLEGYLDDCITWWISLIASILASQCAVSLRVLTISYLGCALERFPLRELIADLDNLIASLPSLTTIYVVDNADHIITTDNASMVKAVGVLFPTTSLKELFAF